MRFILINKMTSEMEIAKLTPPDLDVRADARPLKLAIKITLIIGAAIVATVLIWQGVTAAGNPDPTVANVSPWGAIMDVGVLVFREGLECILVLAAITASMTGEKESHRKPVVAGAAIAMVATIATWFVAVGILHDLGESIPALQLQAWSGLLAVVVLLVVMNWFFHKIYWGGWISLHNRKKKALLNGPQTAHGKMWWGLGLLGFASLYREGFEVVLFLQGYYLKMGGRPVLVGALVGLGLSAVVAFLTFVGQRRLPYRKMLIFTGVLLGVVLLVMVGEQAQEMQLAKLFGMQTTTIPWLVRYIPDWAGVWFSVFPTVETLAAQGLAALIVVGSYYGSRRMARG